MPSLVVIDGTPLDIDPDTYSISSKKRGSVHELIDGGSVFQDRGFSVTDLRVSMKGRFIDPDTRAAIFASYVLSPNEFTFSDYKGNIFQCIFEPGAPNMPITPTRGSGLSEEFELRLAVISVTSWFGGAFPALS